MFISKEIVTILWDNIFYRFTSVEGMVVSLYDGCRFVHLVNRQGNRVLVSFI